MKTIYIGLTYFICIVAIKGHNAQHNASKRPTQAESHLHSKINQKISTNDSSPTSTFEIPSSRSFSIINTPPNEPIVSKKNETNDATTEFISAASKIIEDIHTVISSNSGSSTPIPTTTDNSSDITEFSTGTTMKLAKTNQIETNNYSSKITNSTEAKQKDTETSITSTIPTSSRTLISTTIQSSTVEINGTVGSSNIMDKSTILTTNAISILGSTESSAFETSSTVDSSSSANTLPSSTTESKDASPGKSTVLVSSVVQFNISSTPSETAAVESTSFPSPKESTSVPSKATKGISTSILPGSQGDASTSIKEKTPGIITVTFSPLGNGLTPNIPDETPLPTFTTAGSRALRLAVSITFLVIAVVATVVLLVYMIRIKRRTVLYDELRLLP